MGGGGQEDMSLRLFRSKRLGQTGYSMDACLHTDEKD
jgi:hypothetical protein